MKGIPCQFVHVVFGGSADQWWLRPLKRGFRHCFPVLFDGENWIVAEPLCGRLMVAKLPVPQGFDLPGFYTRAGLRVLGPFAASSPVPRFFPWFWPSTCVEITRQILGGDAPFAITPYGLFKALGGKL